MLAEIVDAVIIVDRVVGLHSISSTQAVFHDHDRDAVTVVDFIEREAQTVCINSPAPLGVFQIWIPDACRKVALYLLFALCILCRDQRGAVVRKAVEVDRSGFQHRSILCGHIQLYAILLPNAV